MYVKALHDKTEKETKKNKKTLMLKDSTKSEKVWHNTRLEFEVKE